MPRNLRHRSSSVGSQHSEGEVACTNGVQQQHQQLSSSRRTGGVAPSPTDDFETARRLLTSLLYVKDASGRSYLHNRLHLSWAKALLDRAKSLDDFQEHHHGRRPHHPHHHSKDSSGNTNHSNNNNSLAPFATTAPSLQRRFLLQPDMESGYTPLHRAILGGDLAAMLLLLRHAMDTGATGRLTQRPMAVLHSADDPPAGAGGSGLATGLSHGNYNNNNNSSNLLAAMAAATDREGLTPLQLMGHLQRSELARCRRAAERDLPTVDRSATTRLRPRQSSFGGAADGDDDDDDDDGRIDYFSENGDLLNTEAAASRPEPSGCDEYACEVVTYGRRHHCALGVVQGGGCATGPTGSAAAAGGGGGGRHSGTFCPQRVQTFAQERVGRGGAAVAVAAAAHHTLVATRDGHVYVCGLEKGGRLGLGDDQPQQCPLPRRILGALQRRHVSAVAAAENHSLCVTREGQVYAWGSNRFGQLGDSTVAGGSSNGNGNPASDGGGGGRVRKNPRENGGSTGGRSLPRRVEDLKHHPCVAVAAGERHSVALTRIGEVYVWGDNGAGQLGVPRRSGIQKVQRVEALWGQNSHPKVAVAISAADQSTLVLTGPTPGLTNVNSVYEWGHGNHVPIRVHFENSRQDGGGRRDGRSTIISKSKLPPPSSSLAPHSGRVANPVAIACARYHNAAITADGRVYTWGLHAESLGRNTNSKSPKLQEQQQRRNSLPELVSGMLPEKGGGFAVAIAAADQHTAVVCDNGALFTWGTTDGKDLLGHEGVRWQPNPKRVPGVHRAVNVALAKEHTVLLIGTSFPAIPKSDRPSSLELIAARKAAEHVDLFNAIPVLIMAERTECPFLIEYCTNFIRRNLDGVLNVSKKSEMNQYLEDMLADTTYRAGKRYRDDHHHPFVFDVLTAGNEGRPNFDCPWFSNFKEWREGCRELFRSRVVKRLLAISDVREYEENGQNLKNKPRRASLLDDYEESKQGARSLSGGLIQSEMKVAPKRKENTLDQCIKKTANMDLSTTALANEQSEWLSKEIRAVRKKLTQIAHLQESSQVRAVVLSTEERAKVDRRHTLEAELSVYESAMEEVERRIKELENHDAPKPSPSSNGSQGNQEQSKLDPLRVQFVDDEMNKTMRETIENPVEAKEEAKYFCELCQVKCSDMSNLILHQNGRRHRNRVIQVGEEEKKLAAKSIHEQQQATQFKSASFQARIPKKPTMHAWGGSSTQPIYKLPPPPHPVVAQVAPQSREGLMRKDSVSKPTSHFKAISPVASNFVGILKEQQEAAKLIPSKVMQRTKTTPIWDSSPGSTRCVPLSLYTTPHGEAMSLESQRERRGSVSLADFLNPSTFRKSASSVSAASVSPGVSCPIVAPWLSPPVETATNAKSIMQIVSEEAELRARQDKSYGKGGGSWFVERRERADSLVEIQKRAEKDLEHRQLVEEQLQIEAQIQEDLRRQREVGEKKPGRSGGSRPNRKTRKASGDHSNEVGSFVKAPATPTPKSTTNKSKSTQKDTQNARVTTIP